MTSPAADVEPASATTSFDRPALACLAVQHASSSWGYRAAEFAFPLYLIILFPHTLFPASIYGLIFSFV